MTPLSRAGPSPSQPPVCLQLCSGGRTGHPPPRGPGVGSDASRPPAGRQVFAGSDSPSEASYLPSLRPPVVGFLLKQHVRIPGDEKPPCSSCLLPRTPLRFLETLEFFYFQFGEYSRSQRYIFPIFLHLKYVFFFLLVEKKIKEICSQSEAVIFLKQL